MILGRRNNRARPKEIVQETELASGRFQRVVCPGRRWSKHASDASDGGRFDRARYPCNHVSSNDGAEDQAELLAIAAFTTPGIHKDTHVGGLSCLGPFYRSWAPFVRQRIPTENSAIGKDGEGYGKGRIRSSAARREPCCTREGPEEDVVRETAATAPKRRARTTDDEFDEAPVLLDDNESAEDQPNDDPEDPLNWPQWKKELNFVALLMTVGLIGGMKTAYMSVNSVLAVRFNVSYTAVASLTAVPLVLSAFTGLFSLAGSKMWGKRPVYLVSVVLIFIGAIWNMRAGNSFGQCMGARVFQGLGWGAFDTLVLGSIQDTYFEHERSARITMYHVLSISTTWGAPLFGGLASFNAGRFTIQFDIINAFQIIAIPLILFGAPETAYDRWSSGSVAQTPASGVSWMSRPPKPLGKPSVEEVKAYLRTMKPLSFTGMTDVRTLLQAPRAFVAPTTLLLFVITFIPYCALWSLTESLSLLFFPMPWMLRENSIGSLMAAPFIFSILTATGLAVYQKRHVGYSPYHTFCTLAGGTALAATGILAFGLKTNAVMSEVADEDPASVFKLDGVGAHLSFPLLSFLLGFLAAGATVVDTAIRPIIWRSTQFTSSNMNVCLRNVADMNAGVTCWRNLFAGIFVMTIPNAIVMWAGLKSTVIGLGVAQILVAIAVCCAWWLYDEQVRRMDGHVMGLVDLSMLKRTGSFFDTD
ncbi:major facilitator superfamily transporter [Colletotrichum nymphaeae SA-01]|uniref:Major facilitator superfamily transporter n=1 Tax=Colletotrichum nymphaeae SA-01 TaxID=1460502 RepID=A0A135UJT8_9PEZI|nr:major facilitator superfamily transporter [Colletotrichum nymphaeae SA-01]